MNKQYVSSIVLLSGTTWVNKTACPYLNSILKWGWATNKRMKYLLCIGLILSTCCIFNAPYKLAAIYHKSQGLSQVPVYI